MTPHNFEQLLDDVLDLMVAASPEFAARLDAPIIPHTNWKSDRTKVRAALARYLIRFFCLELDSHCFDLCVPAPFHRYLDYQLRQECMAQAIPLGPPLEVDDPDRK